MLIFIVVNIKNVQRVGNLYEFFLSQTDDNCHGAKSQVIEKILQRMVVLPLILYNTIEGDVRGLHEIHW